VVDASSETVADAAQSAWLVLLKDPTPVSFAEVRFLPWLEARLIDYLRAQTALKNQHISTDEMEAIDEDGNTVSIESTFGGDPLDQPDEELDRKALEKRLTKKWSGMDKKIRNAVFFRLEMNYDWPTVAKFLKCSIPTARTYYQIGLKRLKGEME
jgi:DNA-directed RNA polymerase specialized sigma24 family protein